jgi:hypothetical protein
MSLPFSAHLVGTIHQREVDGGLVLVDIRSRLSGGTAGALEIQIQGQPVGDGGVAMTTSRVAMGPPANPLEYRGRVRALNGARVLASVSNGQSSADLQLGLSIDQANRSVSGNVRAQPLGSSS